MLVNSFPKVRKKSLSGILMPKKQNKLVYVPNIITVKRMSIPDMDNIHKYALKYFDNQLKSLPNYQEQLLNAQLSLGPHQNYVERCQTNNTIAEIEQLIENINSGRDQVNYLNEITPLMENYRKCFRDTGKTIFGEEVPLEDEELTKHMLLFIEVVRRYTGITFNIELPSKYCCIECDFDLSNAIPDMDGTIRCPECRVENESTRCPKKIMILTKGISSHSDYSERSNFYKFIVRFQGKYVPIIEKELTKRLDEYFIKEKKPIGKQIKQLPINYKGFKDGTSLNMMLKALSTCNYSEHYDNAYLISSRYWGWELADFGTDEGIIMYIYDITQVAYNNIRNKTRSSSISIPFKAFKIIEMLGYPYEMTDFKIPKDDKSREDIEKYWKISCETCGDSNVVYIPTRRF